MHLNHPQSPVNRMGGYTVDVLIQFVFSSVMEFLFLTRSQVVLTLLVHGPHFEKPCLQWTFLVCLGSWDKWVSAPQNFWISFQGESEPPHSLGGPSSLCHCPKAQANPSSSCPSLPDTTWGCGSDQEFQQEAGQREHAGDDEQGCGQRAPREYPSLGSLYVHLSRLSLSQDELLVLSHLWKPCVYSWWFSPPDVTTGELVWLERVMAGQKTEILTPVLCLQFILSHCTSDILLSLFSIDEIALSDFF